MSAECHKHGTDLVYPAGSWPVGVCETCELESVRADRALLIEALRRCLRDRRERDKVFAQATSALRHVGALEEEMLR